MVYGVDCFIGKKIKGLIIHRTLTAGEVSLYVQLVSILIGLDSRYVLITTYCLAIVNPVKLEASCSVILCPTVSVPWNIPFCKLHNESYLSTYCVYAIQKLISNWSYIFHVIFKGTVMLYAVTSPISSPDWSCKRFGKKPISAYLCLPTYIYLHSYVYPLMCVVET